MAHYRGAMEGQPPWRMDDLASVSERMQKGFAVVTAFLDGPVDAAYRRDVIAKIADDAGALNLLYGLAELAALMVGDLADARGEDRVETLRKEAAAIAFIAGEARRQADEEDTE